MVARGVRIQCWMSGLGLELPGYDIDHDEGEDDAKRSLGSGDEDEEDVSGGSEMRGVVGIDGISLGSAVS